MFLFLSKLLPLFVYPVGLATLLLIAALIFCRYRRVQVICIAFALFILLFFGNAWVSSTLVSSLEWRNLPSGELPHAQAIVLLGGGTRPKLPPRQTSETNEAGDRIAYAARLFKEGKAPVIIVSGGFIDFYGSLVPEAEAMKELLIAYDIPEKAIIEESQSRNTYENATDVRAIADQRGYNQILLVTSAMHMPRALAIFQKQGFDVTPAPTDFLTTWGQKGSTGAVGVFGLVLKILPDSERLDFSSRAIREYIGLFVYRLRGWL